MQQQQISPFRGQSLLSCHPMGQGQGNDEYLLRGLPSGNAFPSPDQNQRYRVECSCRVWKQSRLKRRDESERREREKQRDRTRWGSAMLAQWSRYSDFTSSKFLN